MKVRLLAVILFFLAGFAWSVSAGEKSENHQARTIVHRFFTLVHRREYREAYRHFSRAVQKDVSFSRFREGAQDVSYLKILKINVTDQEENLIKMDMEALVHLRYKGNLYEAVYRGNVVLYREGEQWKLIRIELKATQQRPLDREAPPGDLQTLDFGT